MMLTFNKSNWKSYKLGDLVEWYQKDIPNSKQIGFGIKYYVTAEHIDSDSIKFNRYNELVDGQKGPTITKHFEKGDLLLSTRSVALRKAAISPISGVTGEKLLVLRVKNNSELLESLFPYVFKSNQFWKFAQNSASGSVNKFTSWTKLREYEFLLPPKAEQARLAELLWAMDDVIEKEKGVLDILEKAYISIIEKEIIDKKSEKIYFKELGKMIRGVGYKPEDLLEVYSENSFILLRSNNISDSKVNYKQVYYLPTNLLNEDQLLIPGDYAICMSNGSKELVGKAARFEGYDKKVSIGSFCAGFRPKDVLSGDLINHLFASESYRQTIKRILSGSAINNLKPSDIEELYLRLNLENVKFSSKLKSLNSMVNNKIQLESKISASQSLQRSLINQIF